MSGIIKDKGQIIRTTCKRCWVMMLKWERWPRELEVQFPYPFDRICGHCLTKQEVDFYKKTRGLTMANEKKICGVFTYNSERKKFNNFIFEAQGGVVGDIYIPKDIKEIPSEIILQNGDKGEQL